MAKNSLKTKKRKNRSCIAEAQKLFYKRLIGGEVIRRDGAVEVLRKGGLKSGEINRLDPDQVLDDILENDLIVEVDEQICLAKCHRQSMCKLFQEMPILNKSTIYKDSKKRIAKKTVDVLIGDDDIHSVYFTLGTTVYQIAKVLSTIESDKQLRIHTNSILVLCELGPHLDVYPKLAGELHLHKGAVYDDFSLRRVHELNIDTVVCSFSEVSFDSGFSSDSVRDKPEKISNLKAAKAKKILIPLCWEKFAVPAPDRQVATRQDLCSDKEYIFIVDPPENWQEDTDRREDYAKWNALSNVHFIFC